MWKGLWNFAYKRNKRIFQKLESRIFLLTCHSHHCFRADSRVIHILRHTCYKSPLNKLNPALVGVCNLWFNSLWNKWQYSLSCFLQPKVLFVSQCVLVFRLCLLSHYIEGYWLCNYGLCLQVWCEQHELFIINLEEKSLRLSFMA